MRAPASESKSPEGAVNQNEKPSSASKHLLVLIGRTPSHSSATAALVSVLSRGISSGPEH